MQYVLPAARRSGARPEGDWTTRTPGVCARPGGVERVETVCGPRCSRGHVRPQADTRDRRRPARAVVDDGTAVATRGLDVVAEPAVDDRAVHERHRVPEAFAESGVRPPAPPGLSSVGRPDDEHEMVEAGSPRCSGASRRARDVVRRRTRAPRGRRRERRSDGSSSPPARPRRRATQHRSPRTAARAVPQHEPSSRTARRPGGRGAPAGGCPSVGGSPGSTPIRRRWSSSGSSSSPCSIA